jgi:hypothetical protein
MLDRYTLFALFRIAVAIWLLSQFARYVIGSC